MVTGNIFARWGCFSVLCAALAACNHTALHSNTPGITEPESSINTVLIPKKQTEPDPSVARILVTSSKIVAPNHSSVQPFRQKDKRWANERLGSSRNTIGAGGCLVTASAIALDGLGYDVDPGSLTRALNASQGFTTRGWLRWDRLEAVTGGAIQAYYFDHGGLAEVDACLSLNMFPMVKFKLANGRPHWVVVTAKGGDQYAVQDPAASSHHALPLSALTPSIRGVRCIGSSDINIADYASLAAGE